MQNKDRKDNAFPFLMLLLILLGLASLEHDEVVTSSSLDNLLQDPLDLSIWYLDLPVSLGVIWCGNLVHNPVLTKQSPHGPIAEMGALVTNDSPRNSKPAKYERPNKVHNYSSIISFGGFGFHPFWNIVNNKQDVSETKRDKEKAHEIYTPNIEDLTK